MPDLPSSRAAPQEVIVFHDPDKQVREKLLRKRAALKSALSGAKVDVDTRKPLKIKRLTKTDYHDMLRFGIAESKGEEKNKARMRLAVALGAKPPKKGTGNYKAFLEKQREEKEEKTKRVEERNIIQTAIKNADPSSRNKKNPTKRKKRGKNEVSGGGVDGQIGKYKRGIQFISPKDLGISGGGNKSSKKGKR